MLITVFLMKFADCALGTLKAVFLVKDKFFVSSIFNSLSAALFIFVADAMAKAPQEDKLLIAAVIFLANLAGGYLPPKLINRLETDKLFVYVITSTSFEQGIQLADNLRKHNVAVATTIAYDKKLNKVLTCRAFASSRDESKLIDRHLTDDFKWHVVQAL